MYYVYILQSINRPDQIYIGCTENLERRLAEHNTGNTFHTNKYSPWKILIYVVIDDKSKAFEFEEYLKSGSGRSFLYKRLIGALPEVKIDKAIQVAAIEQFLNFVSKRFAVYLDAISGNRNVDNRSVETNEIFAIYNCLSDMYTQWKFLRDKICVYDMEIPVLMYLARIRNRAQRKLFKIDDNINADAIIKMGYSLSGYSFPLFEKGSRFILMHSDLRALIKEIKLQLNEKIKVI